MTISRSFILASLFCLFANPYSIVMYCAFSKGLSSAIVWCFILTIAGNVVANYMLYRELTKHNISGFFSIMKYVLIPYTIALTIPIAEIGYVMANMEISRILYGTPRPEEVQLLNMAVVYTVLAYVAHILIATVIHYTITKLKLRRG